MPAKPQHLALLKIIAVKGGVTDYVSVTSGEVAKKLGKSQQSASKLILEVMAKGLLTRRLQARKQNLILTDDGAALLRREYLDLKNVFESESRLVIRGRVTTGIGEGQYYITQAGYSCQFKETLGFVPYKGTLNLKLVGRELAKLEMLKSSGGIKVEGFESDGRTFGEVRCFPAEIGDGDGSKKVSGAVIVPMRSHHSNIVEIISKEFLRDALKLADGDVAVLEL